MNQSGNTNKNLTFKEKMQLVNRLLACPSVQEQQRRDTIINELPPKIKDSVKRNPVSLDDVLNLVNTCLTHDDEVNSYLKCIYF